MKCEARGKDIVGMGRGEGDTRRSGVGEKRKKGRRVLLPKIGEFDGRNHIWERKKTPSRYHRVESLTLGVNAAEKEKLRTDVAGGMQLVVQHFLGERNCRSFGSKLLREIGCCFDTRSLGSQSPPCSPSLLFLISDPQWCCHLQICKFNGIVLSCTVVVVHGVKIEDTRELRTQPCSDLQWKTTPVSALSPMFMPSQTVLYWGHVRWASPRKYCFDPAA